MSLLALSPDRLRTVQVGFGEFHRDCVDVGMPLCDLQLQREQTQKCQSRAGEQTAHDTFTFKKPTGRNRLGSSALIYWMYAQQASGRTPPRQRHRPGIQFLREPRSAEESTLLSGITELCQTF